MLEGLENLTPLVAVLLLFVATVGLFLRFQTEQGKRAQKIADAFQATTKLCARVIGENTAVMKSFSENQTDIKIALKELKKN